MAAPSWSSTPWVATTSAWRKGRVPYETNGTALHTLDVWIPRSLNAEDDDIESEYVPARFGTWIIYIHGGAWRDPLIDSSSFDITASKLLNDPESFFTGIISINYPLSRHPDHPTPSGEPSEANIDPGRSAKHPDHIIAVLSAIAYVQQQIGIAHDYVLVGHSCGATLAFQAVMDAGRWSKAASSNLPVPAIKKPSTVVGLNGLYDLPYFIHDSQGSHASLAPVYADFTRGAFGDDEQDWKVVCPTVVEDWAAEWPEGRVVVMVQSKEDTLVPYSQTELMKKRLIGHSKLKVVEMDAGGDHNEIWERGDELVAILLRTLASLASL